MLALFSLAAVALYISWFPVVLPAQIYTVTVLASSDVCYMYVQVLYYKFAFSQAFSSLPEWINICQI